MRKLLLGEGPIGGQVGWVHDKGLQVGVAVETEEPDGLLGVVEQDQGDGVRARGPDGERRLDGLGQCRDAGVLEQPQHLDELTGARVPEIGFQAPAQGGEASGQLPVLERSGEVDGPGLSLQQGQVVQRVKGRVLVAPVPRVPGDDVGPARDGDVLDAAHHGHFVMGIGRRHRVVVAVEAHERERVGMALGDPAGLEGLGGKCQHGGAVVDQALGLGADLSPHPAEQIAVAGRGQVLIQRCP